MKKTKKTYEVGFTHTLTYEGTIEVEATNADEAAEMAAEMLNDNGVSEYASGSVDENTEFDEPIEA